LLSFTTAFIALGLSLRVHTRSQLHHNNANTFALARFARLDCLRIRPTDTVTLGAYSVSLDLNIGLFAIVQVFKTYFELDTHWFYLLSLGTTATAAAAHAEHVEDVTEALRLAATLHALLTHFIIKLALLGIAEHFISDCDLLELLSITSLIWEIGRAHV
jgi:hypothetical protein